MKDKELEKYLLRMMATRDWIKIYRNPKRLGQKGLGFRRSSFDTPFKCEVLASFKLNYGGGYVVRREEDQKIVQVQSFKQEGE